MGRFVFAAGGWRIFYVVLNEVIDGGGRGHESVQSDKIFRNVGSLFSFLQHLGAVGVVDRCDGLWVGIVFFWGGVGRGMGFLAVWVGGGG